MTDMPDAHRDELNDESWRDWLPKNNTVAVRLNPEAAYLLARDAFSLGIKTSTRAKKVIEEFYCGKPETASDDRGGSDLVFLGSQFREVIGVVRPVLEKKRADRMSGSLIPRLSHRDSVSDDDCVEWILNALDKALRDEEDAVS